MAISHTPTIEAEAVRTAASRASELQHAQPIEELFTRFEHYTALAQLALEDLQMQLASMQLGAMQPAQVAVGVDSDPPPNVLSFRRD